MSLLLLSLFVWALMGSGQSSEQVEPPRSTRSKRLHRGVSSAGGGGGGGAGAGDEEGGGGNIASSADGHCHHSAAVDNSIKVSAPAVPPRISPQMTPQTVYKQPTVMPIDPPQRSAPPSPVPVPAAVPLAEPVDVVIAPSKPQLPPPPPPLPPPDPVMAESISRGHKAHVWSALVEWAIPLLPAHVTPTFIESTVAQRILAVSNSEEFTALLHRRQLERRQRRRETAHLAAAGLPAPLPNSPHSTPEATIQSPYTSATLPIPFDVAEKILSFDAKLSELRLKYVPARVTEDTFFVEYFTLVVAAIGEHVAYQSAVGTKTKLIGGADAAPPSNGSEVGTEADRLLDVPDMIPT